MVNSIDYIHELNKVNKKICNFFKKSGLFFSEDLGFASYQSVKGDGALDVPDGTSLSKKVWPVDNQRTQDLAEAIHSCEKVGRKFFSPEKNQDLKVLSRHFMIEGGTHPIKVTYEITTHKGKKKQESCTDALYVKQMSLNRIFLGSLYHLAMFRDYPMAFSESSVVEREIRGPTIQELYSRGNFLKNPRMRREFVKLNVVSYFLSLFDMDNGANTVLDSWQRFQVIDFDKAFWEPIPNPRESLLNPFVYEVKYGNGETQIFPLPDDKLVRPFKRGELDILVSQEMARIYHNIAKNSDLFNGIVDLMSDISYYNLAAKELYGKKDVVSYFSSRLDEFGQR